VSSLSLTEYVKAHAGNLFLAHSLVDKFLSGNPPQNSSSSKAVHDYHDCYLSKKSKEKLLSAAAAILERERELSRRSGKYISLPVGVSEAEEKQLVSHNYLQKKSLFYAYYGLGNCSHRASFSAIYLAKSLEGTGVKVALFSFIERDQFVVLLTDTARTLIYDPLTNPEKLYESEYYKKHILEVCFDKIPDHLVAKRKRMRLIVEADQYDRLQVTLNAHHGESVDFGSVDVLLDDKDFVRVLVGNATEKRKLTINALKLLKAIRENPDSAAVPVLVSRLVTATVAGGSPEKISQTFFSQAPESGVSLASRVETPDSAVIAFIDSLDIEKPAETISSVGLLGIAESCLFAMKHGLPLKEWITEEQLKSAEEFGVDFS
jgi:hypothetical protein